MPFLYAFYEFLSINLFIARNCRVYHVPCLFTFYLHCFSLLTLVYFYFVLLPIATYQLLWLWTCFPFSGTSWTPVYPMYMINQLVVHLFIKLLHFPTVRQLKVRLTGVKVCKIYKIIVRFLHSLAYFWQTSWIKKFFQLTSTLELKLIKSSGYIYFYNLLCIFA